MLTVASSHCIIAITYWFSCFVSFCHYSTAQAQRPRSTYRRMACAASTVLEPCISETVLGAEHHESVEVRLHGRFIYDCNKSFYMRCDTCLWEKNVISLYSDIKNKHSDARCSRLRLEKSILTRLLTPCIIHIFTARIHTFEPLPFREWHFFTIRLSIPLIFNWTARSLKQHFRNVM